MKNAKRRDRPKPKCLAALLFVIGVVMVGPNQSEARGPERSEGTREGELIEYKVYLPGSGRLAMRIGGITLGCEIRNVSPCRNGKQTITFECASFRAFGGWRGRHRRYKTISCKTA